MDRCCIQVLETGIYNRLLNILKFFEGYKLRLKFNLCVNLIQLGSSVFTKAEGLALFDIEMYYKGAP